jgi:S-methylmethionine-dependent homocysteine/selenocysteine methylase
MYGLGKVQSNIQILDGGFGTTLRDHYGNNDNMIWSLRPLVDNRPDIFRKCHQLFIDAGCDIITTGNYCATPYYMNKITRLTDLKSYITQAGAIASAIARANTLACAKLISVAGSIPPYGESYTPGYIPNNNLIDHYQTTAHCLYDHCDYYLAETIASQNEAKLIYQAVRNKPLYLSFSVKEDGISLLDGSNICTVLHDIQYDIAGVMLNCCPISHVERGLPLISKHLNDLNINIKLGAYPNLHEHIPEHFCLENGQKIKYLDVTPNQFGDICQSWTGLDFVGGCCGVGPEYIAQLKLKLKF